MSDTLVKICGLSEEISLRTAIEEEADYLGFVFYPKSLRNLTYDDASTLLEKVDIPRKILKVAVVVNPDNQHLQQICEAISPDYIQLHGTESPERVDRVTVEFGIPVIKALPVSGAPDIARINEYIDVASMILLDAKAPAGSDIPGGNGISFDWSLLANQPLPAIPTILSGGLDKDNVSQAITETGIKIVDVSSGVESSPGVKDVKKIQEFIKAAKS